MAMEPGSRGRAAGVRGGRPGVGAPGARPVDSVMALEALLNPVRILRIRRSICQCITLNSPIPTPSTQSHGGTGALSVTACPVVTFWQTAVCRFMPVSQALSGYPLTSTS